MSTLVYKFGLLPPRENAALVHEQMRLAHRYRNELIEIERGRRAALRSLASNSERVSELEAVLTLTRDEETRIARDIKAQHAAERSRKASAESREALAAARARTKEVKAQLRAARAEQRESQAPEIARINGRAFELERSARAHSGLFWGTYELCDAAAEAARRAPIYDLDGVPHDPRFVRWTGDGSVGVRIKGGLIEREVFSAEDTRLRIEREEVPHKRRPGDTFVCYTLAIRVGSDGVRPIWARFPMKLHRALPVDAVIKNATVTLRRRARRDEWSVQFTIDAPARGQCGDGGAVGVDLGWRKIGDEIRVAVWHGEDGSHGEIRLSARAISGIEKADELRSLRDDHFNAARAWFVEWLRDRDVPAWFTDATRTIADWRSPARLASLAQRWKRERFNGDGDGLLGLELWRYRDHHLWTWEVHQRIGALRHRKDVYRNAAAALARRYSTVTFEEFDLRKFARRPRAEDEKDEGLRRQRSLAAPSELRLVVRQAFLARGGQAGEVPAIDSTRTCNVCGVVADKVGADIMHTCLGCGTTWDQDHNAASYILRYWLDNPPPSKESAKRETRWAKRTRLAEEKTRRLGEPTAETSSGEKHPKRGDKTGTDDEE